MRSSRSLREVWRGAHDGWFGGGKAVDVDFDWQSPGRTGLAQVCMLWKQFRRCQAELVPKDEGC